MIELTLLILWVIVFEELSFLVWNARALPYPGKSNLHRGSEVYLRHRHGRPDPQQNEAVTVRQEEEYEKVCDEHRGFVRGTGRQGNIC